MPIPICNQDSKAIYDSCMSDRRIFHISKEKHHQYCCNVMSCSNPENIVDNCPKYVPPPTPHFGDIKPGELKSVKHNLKYVHHGIGVL